ncbi:hypothetical protein VTO42DRAFT_5416 [Malbranchea cinnamomea]
MLVGQGPHRGRGRFRASLLVTMVSPALLLLSVSFYLVSSLRGWAGARPAVGGLVLDDAGTSTTVGGELDGQHHGGDRGGSRRGQLGAVACEQAICSDIGAEMLRKGGNAADAMVATVFCVGVTAMYHSGIGGGGFMLVRAPNGTLEFVDFRETAPAAAFEDMFTNNTQASIYGGLASGVPGEVRGLEYLHKLYGVLPWATVMEPAINVARYGWRIGEDMVRYMDDAVKHAGHDFLTEDPAWAIDFAPNGTRLGRGDVITRRRYADTLEAIASRGADAFYTGPIAQATINALQRANGTMTMEDLRNYTVAIREPAEIEYRGYKIASTTAPSGGPIGLSILNIVAGYDDFFAPDTLHLSTHRLNEAMRFAYGQRTKFGDPLFVSNLSDYQSAILSPQTAAKIRSRISDERTQDVSAYDPAGLESRDTPGTSHISTTDAAGLTISLTTTVNLLFGSTLMVPETGVIMNNEMNDFSIPGSSNAFGYIPSPANFVRPGKRPLSSICPLIVSDARTGAVYFVTGAAGGSRIITAAVQTAINVLDRGMNAATSLAQPRMHDQLMPPRTTFEWAFDNSTVRALADMGHNVTWVGPGQSAVQAIRVLHLLEGDGRAFEPASEPRQVDAGGSAV